MMPPPPTLRFELLCADFGFVARPCALLAAKTFAKAALSFETLFFMAGSPAG
jgi:hypothetical protein